MPTSSHLSQVLTTTVSPVLLPFSFDYLSISNAVGTPISVDMDDISTGFSVYSFSGNYTLAHSSVPDVVRYPCLTTRLLRLDEDKSGTSIPPTSMQHLKRESGLDGWPREAHLSH